MGLITGLLTAAEVVSSIADMENSIPSPPANLKDKSRWLTVTIFNQTQFEILYQGKDYFDSGRFWTAPTNIAAFSEMTFSGCNRNWAPTGVTGGAVFRIDLNGADHLDVGVGFTNPLIGSFKASVVLTSKAKDAYDKATNSSMYTESKYFGGKTKDGDDESIYLKLASAPGQQASITITEVVAS